MKDQTPGITYYSMGIVAEHKPYNSNKIEVIPIDVNPQQMGLVTGEVEELIATFKDETGATNDAKSYASKTITAEWYGDEGNRTSSPDVSRGDFVRLYRKYDSTEFLWRSQNNNQGKNRRREKVRWVFSGTDDPDAERNESNSVVIDFDMIAGVLTLSTPSTGEVTSYTLQANYSNHSLSITDSNNCFVELGKDRVTAHNSSESYVELDGPNITAKCDGTVSVSATNVVADAETITTTAPTTTLNGNALLLNFQSIGLGSGGTINGDALAYTGPVEFQNAINLNGTSIAASAAVLAQLAQLLYPFLDTRYRRL